MQERRRVTEMRESSTLDQRRVQQRLKHMEQETATLHKQLSIAQIHIEVYNHGNSTYIIYYLLCIVVVFVVSMLYCACSFCLIVCTED